MGAATSSPAAGDQYARAGAAYWSVGVPIASPVTSPRAQKRESDYFYTLVFASTKALDEQESDRRHADERVSYADALATLRAVTSGGREREARVVDEFRAAWVAKFRTPAPLAHDSIPRRYFQELMRELIVQRFDTVPDLFLWTTLSDDGKLILVSFRPSRALLCATADRLQLKVAMMAEVDPGARYWAGDTTRAVAEAYQWNKTDAQEELVRLFLAGKISSQEAQIFDDEDAAMWSRRLHALRRFVDPDVAKIVAAQDATAEATTFLPFKNRASLRYLYRQIDGAAGEEDAATPFRVVDKIRLTKAIIDAEFDCDALVAKGLLAHHCCPHSHHTDAVDTSIDVLRAQWGALGSPWRLFRQGRARLVELPHWQPLAHVRNYFGEEIALYFAYTSSYAEALQWLCVAALAVALLPLVTASDAAWHKHHDVAFAVVSTAFTQTFVRKWAVQERVLAMQWGVAALRDADVPRPQFRGQLAVSAITHRLGAYYPPRRRTLQQVASSVLLLALSLALLSADWLVLTSDWYADAHASGSAVAVHVAIAVVAKALTGPCAAVCVALTEWENHRSQPDHDVSLTLKFAIAQSVNLYGVLWLETFVLPFRVAPEQARGCLDRAAHLLTTFLAVDLAVSLWDLRVAFTRGVLASLPSWRQGTDSDARLLLSSQESASATAQLVAELALDPYEGVMFDYAQVVTTFGWAAWFAALAPSATLLAWGVAVLQIRVDAFKLSALTQRPFPAQKNSVGSWGVFLRVLAFGAWLHNAMLAVLFLATADGSSPSALHDIIGFLRFHDDGNEDNEAAAAARLAAGSRLLTAFVGFCGVSWLARIHDQRDRAQLAELRHRRARQRFLTDKYLHNLDRVPDAVREALPRGRVFLNGVHQYVVTGNKAEEDAAEEILDELVALQRRAVELRRQVHEMRASGASVGVLVVDVGSINILPVMDALTKSVDSFLQLQLTAGEREEDDDEEEEEEEEADASSKKPAKPVNTSAVKKQRSPAWSESFELALRSLDDALLVRVFDWELLGKNRRIGHATLRVADVLATAPPLLPLGKDAPDAQDLASESPRRARSLSAATEATTVATHAQRPSSPSHAPKVRMASFEVAIEMPEALLRSMHADLVRHGHPTLSLRCGVRLDALGRVLLQQRELRASTRQLQAQEKQFVHWKDETTPS